MKNSIYILALSLLPALLMAQQPAPADSQRSPILIKGGTIHVGDGKVIENGSLVIENGKIIIVREGNVSDQGKAKLIDATGKHIYPGFIAPNTVIGLTEIEAARATNDFNEVGQINSNVRALIAYNTDSKVTPTVRTNGVLLAQAVPQGGMVSGQSSIMELDGWNWEDAVYKADDALHVYWPSSLIYGAVWNDAADTQKERVEKQMLSLRTFFADARAYWLTKDNEEKNLRFEGMKSLFNGKQKLFIHADNVKDIIAAIDFSQELKVNMVLVGGADAWMVTGLLKDNNIPVVLNRTHSVPSRSGDDVDMPYRLPSILQKEGILFCLSVDGFWQVRNLPFNAGTAAAYGLTKEQALAAITSNTAKIFGIDKTIGTLTEGKDATLFISTGDALDMRTNNVEAAFIRGKQLDLNNLQKELNEKYKKKYGLK